MTIQAIKSMNVSIHAPTWGATIGFGDISYGFIVSIHAPTWGATDGYKTDKVYQ